jgi:branched-chain amino acid transport system substrate-binding protein
MVSFLTIVLFLSFNGSTALGQNVIKIGSILPLTGPGSPWGINCDRGVQLGADMINEAGGITIKGEKYFFKVYSENDKYTAEGARAAVEKLVNFEKVKFIIGPFSDTTINIAREISTEKKVIILQGSSGGAFTLGPKYPYLFRFSQDTRGKLGVLDVALNTIKFKKMAILNYSDVNGRGSTEAAIAWAKEIGVELTDVILAPGETTDFYPFLKKIIDNKAEMIHGALPISTNALVLKQAHELGYKGYYSHTGSIINVQEFIRIAGKDAVQGYIAPYEFIDCPIITDKHREIMLKMKDNFLKKYGPPFEPVAWRYSIGPQVLALALEKAQSFDPDVLVKTMETMEFDTWLGKGGFTGTKTYGIPRQLVLNTIAAIIKGDKAEYLGYTRVERP